MSADAALRPVAGPEASTGYQPASGPTAMSDTRPPSPGVGRRLEEVVPIPMAHDRPAQQLHGAAAVIAGSVLLDSAIEHYRGSFKNSAMVLPIVASAANIVSSLHGMSAKPVDSHAVRTLAYAAAIGIGAVGTGFHIYNVRNRVGGFRWENLFYGAPLGAPAALALSGLAGLAADRLAGNAQRSGKATLLGLPAGKVVGAFTSVGLLGTVAEAGLLHFRGNFQNPAMYLPVVVPPVAAVAMAAATVRPDERTKKAARFVLAATSILGFAGVAFHCYGVSRAMGGWKNWRQNLIDGPPVPAPPSFSGLAIAGLAALKLLKGSRR